MRTTFSKNIYSYRNIILWKFSYPTTLLHIKYPSSKLKASEINFKSKTIHIYLFQFKNTHTISKWIYFKERFCNSHRKSNKSIKHKCDIGSFKFLLKFVILFFEYREQKLILKNLPMNIFFFLYKESIEHIYCKLEKSCRTY